MAIVTNNYSETTSKALRKANYRVTRLATTGRFLREGASTLMIGVEDDRLEDALAIIREQIPVSQDPKDIHATIYVLNVKDFKRV